MGGSLLSKAEVPGSSLLGHLPKEFSLRLTWCPWLVGYYGTRRISRGARKLVRTPSLSNKKKKNPLPSQRSLQLEELSGNTFALSLSKPCLVLVLYFPLENKQKWRNLGRVE